MTYDKLNESLDKKMLDFNLKILALLGSLLIKPLSLATEPFFRKNFGERYFTATGFVISMILWNLAQAASNALNDSPFFQVLQNSHLHTLSLWGQKHHLTGKIAWVISFIYGYMGMRQYLRIKSRRRNDRPWHSMSRGESIFGRESRGRDILIACSGSFILTIFAPVLGFLFFASQTASIYLARKTESSFYNRYLDIVDAKLENEFMQKCLDRGEPPTDVNGLFYPLPKAIQGEARVRVARVVAGIQLAPNVPGADLPNPQPQPEPNSTHQSVADASTDQSLMSELRSELATFKPVLDDAVRATRKSFSSANEIPGVASLFRIVLAVLAILIIVILCYYGFGLVKAHWPASPKKSEAHPVTAPSQSRQTATVAPNNSVPPIDYAAIEREAMEKKRQTEQIALQRQNTIDQFKSLLKDNADQLVKLQTDCEKHLANNTNRIAAARWFRRGSLRRENEKARAMISQELLSQQTNLVILQEAVQQFSQTTAMDPNTVTDLFNEYNQIAARANQRINDTLKVVDGEISGKKE